MTARLSLVSLGLAMLAAAVVVVNQQVAWAQEEVEASEPVQLDACSRVRCRSGTICRLVEGRAECQATKQPPIIYNPSKKPTKGRCPTICPMIYQPICASNGQTYGNECMFNIAVCNGQKIAIVSRGACESSTTTTTTTEERSAAEPSHEVPCELLCTSDYSPVCGSDGVTYPNACNLISANCYGKKVKQIHEGPCGRNC